MTLRAPWLLFLCPPAKGAILDDWAAWCSLIWLLLWFLWWEGISHQLSKNCMHHLPHPSLHEWTFGHSNITSFKIHMREQKGKLEEWVVPYFLIVECHVTPWTSTWSSDSEQRHLMEWFPEDVSQKSLLRPYKCLPLSRTSVFLTHIFHRYLLNTDNFS